MPPLYSEALFRQAWGNFPTGVSVVTFLGEGGSIHGITATAITSVSLNPPLVLVCVGNTSRSHRMLEESGRFVMNFLAKGQEAACWFFAQKGERPPPPFTFTRTASGYPILAGCVASMDCRIAARHPAGDHTILVGQVEEIDVRGGDPLVFHQGGFALLEPYGS